MFFFGKHQGFKLISLEIKNDKIFGDITYDFLEKEDAQDQIYTTVIIGPNGTRKSLLFKRIVQLFWDLNELKHSPEKEIKYDFWFNLTYALDNLIFQYTNIHPFGETGTILGKSCVIVNGIPQQGSELNYSFDAVRLPDSIVANAIMITDKFPFPDSIKFPQYRYLGSRYRPQLASTSSYISRTVEFIASSIDNISFLEGVNSIMKEFFSNEYDPYIIFYTQNTPYFFDGKLSNAKLVAFYEEIDEKYSKKTTAPPFKLNYYKSKIKGNKELISRITDYCQNLKTNYRLRGFPRTSTKAISFRLNSQDDLDLLKQEIELLNHMKSLGIVYAPEIEFLSYTGDHGELDGYSVFDSSSGEHNLLGAMVGLMATVKPNSLILIDEPEVSLHPNWQMKYLNLIRTLFSNKIYANSHVIIATHSHFLVSDLIASNSKIIGLTRNPNLQTISFPKIDTYGWSAEDVLYNIFNVRSSLNYYLQADLTELLGMIGKGSKDKIKIGLILEKLIRLPVRDNDPLQEIIVEATEYYNSIND